MNQLINLVRKLFNRGGLPVVHCGWFIKMHYDQRFIK